MTPPARPRTRIERSEITGLVLAGGRGSRMGGLDKGLQSFEGMPLALHAVQRLAPQVGPVAVNANRHLASYEAFGVPVWPDGIAGYPGPLAGFLSGLERCRTPWLLTVPCDTPLFPPDLASRLAAALVAHDAEIAMASAPGASPAGEAAPTRPAAAVRAVAEDGPAQALFAQPVFCLLRVAGLRDSLLRFLQSGERKIGAWTARQHTVRVAFDHPGDAADAFVNANTLAELHALEARPLC